MSWNQLQISRLLFLVLEQRSCTEMGTRLRVRGLRSLSRSAVTKGAIAVLGQIPKAQPFEAFAATPTAVSAPRTLVPTAVK